MPNLLAMSFEGQIAPSFNLHCLGEGRDLPDGWGLAYYSAAEPSASILKEPAPPVGSIRSQLASAWEQVESTLFILHIRDATWGAATDANTQPFERAWGKRDWVIAHSGSLDRKQPEPPPGPFEPVGSTDTEQMFCELLNVCAANHWKCLADVDLDVIVKWLGDLNEIGELTLCLSDGRDLLVHADRRGRPLHVGTLTPPYSRIMFGDRDVDVDLTRRGAKSRKGVIVCSEQLTPHAGDAANAITWRKLDPGSLLVVRDGAVIHERSSGNRLAAPGARWRPARAEPKTFDIVHRTVYRYEVPVERSTHLLRLTPVHDYLQGVQSHQLSISVPHHARDYVDVFNNRVRRIMIEAPFSEMIIESRSTVQIIDVNPIGFDPLRERSTIPLVWMPWQRQILDTYLLPFELPETELAELADYAMSFVKRNDYDLLDTLLDINQTIFREYAYKQGETTLLTSAFDVYVNRRGVCQDFTNLMICMARLLGVPARYVCGYIYTGPKTVDANHRQGEESHAWVQLYLPQVGWIGFDPTNGILTQTDHIRIAVGRNYLDATPTSGTIFGGGTGETLSVDVRVEPSTGG